MSFSDQEVSEEAGKMTASIRTFNWWENSLYTLLLPENLEQVQLQTMGGEEEETRIVKQVVCGSQRKPEKMDRGETKRLRNEEGIKDNIKIHNLHQRKI